MNISDANILPYTVCNIYDHISIDMYSMYYIIPCGVLQFGCIIIFENGSFRILYNFPPGIANLLCQFGGFLCHRVTLILYNRVFSCL